MNSSRLSQAGSNVAVHDANGNMTVFTYAYTWDVLDRMTSRDGGGLFNFRYDYQNRRVGIDYQTTRYIYHGLDPVMVGFTKNSTYYENDYLYGPGIDQPLARVDYLGITYYAVDGLGSVVLLNDAAGTVKNKYSHGAFGELLSATDNVTQPFGYTGREFAVMGKSPADSQYYYRARYLEPGVGRFLREDPIRNVSGDLNFYRYVENRPISFNDPLGLAARAPLTRLPQPPEPRRVPCSNCSPDVTNNSRRGLSAICRNTRTNSSCQQVLKRYKLFDCFRDRCMGDAGVPVRCMSERDSCGGCGGPCNSIADYSRTIYLQPAAGSRLCGNLNNTLAHEMAHMCGIGADVDGSNPTHLANRRRAEEIAYACGGPN